jgi:RNase P subunit RPR2
MLINKIINKNGERKELHKVKDFICENCKSELFVPIGCAKTIHLKKNENKHYSFNSVGIKCAICGKEYLNTDNSFI